MVEKKRIYSKSGLERDLLPQQIKKAFVQNVLQLPIVDIPALIYQKPSIEETSKAFFVIISGGEVRERNYFKLILNQDKFKRIKIDFIADPQKLSPRGMFETAEFKKAHFISSRAEEDEPDKIFLVSDVDLFMDELLEIKPKCFAEDLILIISNSCFEIWLYYAYLPEIPKFKIPDEIEKISWKFKGWLPSVIRGGIKPLQAILNIHQNIENTRLNYKEDQNGIPELFCTNMFELAKELLSLIEPELNNLIEDKNKREAEFRNKRKN